MRAHTECCYIRTNKVELQTDAELGAEAAQGAEAELGAEQRAEAAVVEGKQEMLLPLPARQMLTHAE